MYCLGKNVVHVYHIFSFWIVFLILFYILIESIVLVSRWGSMSFKTLVQKDLRIDENTILRMKLDENTRTGSLNLHIREFKTGGEYIGATRNGLSYRIDGLEDLERFEETFKEFVELVREHL